ncbi:MAG: WecB/TagA/CpsF family glycosyltransferase [Anaerolineales bacterium]
MNVARILGIDVACVDLRELLTQVNKWVSETPTERGNVRTISYVNAHCLNVAAENPIYFSHLRSFDLIYPDGIGAVWAGHWLSGKTFHKITGADWIFEFCCLAEAMGWRVYILGGKAGVAQTAGINLQHQFPALHILGTHDGYFPMSESPKIVSEIVSLKPDILFVGLGVPLQEAWIDQWKIELPVKICWAVGALFDYVAGVEPRAPSWMRHYALEWFWRMIVDPGGKWKRYLLGNPLFLARVIGQKFGFRL